MNVVAKTGIRTAVGAGVCEAYQQLTTPKKIWEGSVRMHHGDADVILAAIGLVVKSPALLGMGAGLALHDRDDAAEWSRG